MTHLLITPQEVCEKAFAGGEYMPPEAVSERTILAAQERYLRPVLGDALCRKLAAGDYAELLGEFVGPALACCVKRLMFPELRLQAGACGLAATAGAGWSEASEEAAAAALKSIRAQMRALLQRLSDELERRRGEIPEYDPEKNVLNRCRIHGNLVQIL